MTNDPFDDLLELEDTYYKEGYDAGVSDSTYAGLVEGKVFGVEKGFEKAIELGKLRGRALVWQKRLHKPKSGEIVTRQDIPNDDSASSMADASMLSDIGSTLPGLPTNTRLLKHVEGLLNATSPETIAKDNSDEAVTIFDDRIAKANAKTKVIANIVGEAVDPTSTGSTGIEDATGLIARH